MNQADKGEFMVIETGETDYKRLVELNKTIKLCFDLLYAPGLVEPLSDRKQKMLMEDLTDCQLIKEVILGSLKQIYGLVTPIGLLKHK